MPPHWAKRLEKRNRWGRLESPACALAHTAEPGRGSPGPRRSPAGLDGMRSPRSRS